MEHHNRRTFLRAVGLGTTGALAANYGSGVVAGATTITIQGAGYDIWNGRDEFHYYYTELEGDFDVTVRVDDLEETDPWARAGLMVRQTLSDDAEHAMIRKTPGNGTSLQWRSDDGSQAESTTSDDGSSEAEVSGGTIEATWQRLVRSGDTIEAYGSQDGENWTLIADISPGEVDFAGSAYVGLAVCSHSEGTLTTAEFSNLSGLSPDSNGDIGDVDVAGSVSTSTGGGSGGSDTNVAVSTGSASDVGSASATLSGALDELGGSDSAEVGFEYRESAASSWSATATQTVSSSTSFDADLSGLSPETSYEFRGVATASDGDTDTGSVNTFTTNVAPETGEITVEGAGYDIWNDRDEFHYYYTEVDGDFDVRVRLDEFEATDGWAKTGLMVRQTLNDDAEHAIVRKTPDNATSLQWRSDDGVQAESTTSDDGSSEAAVSGGTMEATWQRLVRSGDTIEAYGSTDGENWTLIADISPGEIDFAGSAYVGLAVSSHDEGTLATAEFSNLSGLSPDSNEDVGDVEVAGSVSTTEGGNDGDEVEDTDPVVSTGSASNVETSSATLSGALDDLGRASSADVYFEWRESDADAWTATESRTLSSPDSYSEPVSGLSAATDHEFRAAADASDGDAAVGSLNTFSTTSDDGDGVAGGSGAYFAPDDGFASPDWFDDDVTVHRVTDPTRSALEDAVQGGDHRLVVFETSGTIDLDGDGLEVTADQCWIAGQTAPSPGITLTQGLFQVNADDVVVQHLRSRVGPGDGGNIQGNDSFNNADDTRNVIFDHCTASWGVDECMSVGYDTDRTTFSNCLIYEGLHDPYGDGADHNYSTLVGNGADNVALLGNVWAKTRSRVPRLKSETRSVVANNVMYFFNEATNMDGDTESSIVGNVYIPQDLEDTVIEGGNAYLEDNVVEPNSTPLTGGTSELSSRPLWPSGLSAMGSSEVESHNLDYAGARPADRTSNDSRIISEIQGREGDAYTDSPYDYWVADHEEVGGYPQLPENTHSLTIPDLGLREWIDQWALAVEDPGASPP
ncbi:hypothetical protein [Halosimplex sp. J119]